MGNFTEKKAFWIILIIAFALLLAGLIFGLVMTIKYGEPGEPRQEEKVAFGTVKPNNAFLDFCNDENMYAFDANLASNPITRVSIVKDGHIRVVTDANETKAIWDSMKNIKIADVSSTGVTSAQYTLTFHRNNGSDALVTFQSPTVLTWNNTNYDISDSAGFFDKL